MDATVDQTLQESCMAALIHMGVEVRALVSKTNELEAENAELRELVRTMNKRDVLLPCMFGCNDDCRFYSGDMCRRIASLMRELRIEVNE